MKKYAIIIFVLIISISIIGCSKDPANKPVNTDESVNYTKYADYIPEKAELQPNTTVVEGLATHVNDNSSAKSNIEKRINSNTITTTNQTTTNKKRTTMKVNINGKSFNAELYDNKTSKAFQDMLPLTLNMEELHGNEKYCYLDNSLPTNSKNVDTIKAGDIMLYGNDCIVLFYESFSTSYSYTKIGCITDTTGLKQAVGNDDVTVIFYLN